jgi:hypothetical protein
MEAKIWQTEITRTCLVARFGGHSFSLEEWLERLLLLLHAIYSGRFQGHRAYVSVEKTISSISFEIPVQNGRTFW